MPDEYDMACEIGGVKNETKIKYNIKSQIAVIIEQIKNLRNFGKVFI